MDKCFKLAVFVQPIYDLIIVLGEREYEEASQWLPLIKGCKHVLFLSLFYFDLTPFEDFF
jgi:hypothetical protein